MREFLARWRTLLEWSRFTPLVEFYDLLKRHIDALRGRVCIYRNPNSLLQSIRKKNPSVYSIDWIRWFDI